MKPDVKIGSWVFVWQFDSWYACPKCKRLLREYSLLGHMDAHDRREEKKRAGESKRELGMGAKPLPGLLALAPDVFGVRDVPKEGA